jgi:hypothetical protein
MEFLVAKNTDCRVAFPIMKTDGTLLSSAAGLDSEFALLGAHGAGAPSFTDCTHEATEIGSTGWYYLDVSAAEVNDDHAVIQVKSSTAGAVTQCLLFNTTFEDTAGVAAAVRDLAIAGAAADSVGAAIASVLTDTGTTIPAQITALTEGGVKKNTELAGFTFFVALASDHVTGATGKTVAVTRSIDGGAFAACANSPATEVSGGWYKIVLAAADLNGSVIAISATAAACDATGFTIITSS